MAEGIQSRLAKAKITRIQTFTQENSLESNITAIQYETKLDMLESAFQEFCFCHNEIIKTSTVGMKEDHAKYYTSVQEIYLHTNCTIKSYIAARRSDFHSGSVLTKFNQPYQIELEPPIFSEDYSEWDSLATNLDSFVKTSTTECPICTDQFHKLYHCQIFKEWDIKSKMIFVNQNNYCYNCLQPAHKVINCKSKYTCHECKQKHHTVLHSSTTVPPVHTKCKLNKSQMYKLYQNYSSSPLTTTSTSQTILIPKPPQIKMSYNFGHVNQQSSNQNSSSKTIIQTNQQQMMNESSRNNKVPTINQDFSSSTTKSYNAPRKTESGILQTPVINSLDASEILQDVRILFASTLQDSFTSEHCIQPQFTRENARNVSNGINNTKGVIPGKVQLSRTRFNPDNEITLQPTFPISNTKISSSQIIKVDILIENNHSLELLLPGLISTPAGHPIITNSLVDWIVSGKNPPCNTTSSSSIQSYNTNLVDTH